MTLLVCLAILAVLLIVIDVLDLPWQYPAAAALFLILILLATSCGYKDGDLDNTIDCIDGCVTPTPSPEAPKPEVIYVPIPGPRGEKGDKGDSGSTGAAGKDGLNGVTINAIELCPSVAGAYKEILLCIDGRLYAVYDGGANRDRLVEVTPGSYNTTDGRMCGFTVVQGCEVQ